jgi:RNase H-fold protein (predicted Holliday junction resolvase)
MFCGIDPGSEKFGLAVVNGEELVFSAIVPIDKIDSAVGCIACSDMNNISKWHIEGDPASVVKLDGVYLGNGTFHVKYEEKLKEKNIRYELVDERMTTLQAREIYWKLHPPKGLSRIIPRGWRIPPRPIDDLAAVAIVVRARRNT